MTMKKEPIPVIAVFKNGIVNVNKTVAVSDGAVVRTWFVNKIQELDKCRKGALIYKR